MTSQMVCCYLDVHHSDELSWTVQTVETSLLHQLTHNLIGYLREKKTSLLFSAIIKNKTQRERDTDSLLHFSLKDSL